MSGEHITGDAAFLSGSVTSAVGFGGGFEGKGSTYTVTGEDGREYVCDYTDLVTDGFRTLKWGDRVRFAPVDEVIELRARHVLKLNEPDLNDYDG